MDNLLQFEMKNLYFNYPFEEPTLKDIKININAGEKLCILGANGSGKSTLLKVLSGLIYPQKGEFRAFGRIVTEKDFSDDSFLSEYHKNVGFIFQNSDTQLFCSTVYEEIAFGPMQFGVPLDEVHQRVRDVLELFCIGHLEDKAPFKLSGGEKKKVAIAAVLVMNPKVLILDEPTNGLDPRTQRWLVELLVNLNRTGKTVITSTHNLELVREISDRTIVFDEGHKIAMDATTEEVLQNTDLLRKVNIIDEYYHRHGDGKHAHYHVHNY